VPGKQARLPIPTTLFCSSAGALPHLGRLSLYGVIGVSVITAFANDGPRTLLVSRFVFWLDAIAAHGENVAHRLVTEAQPEAVFEVLRSGWC
jgi:hypothetical protein